MTRPALRGLYAVTDPALTPGEQLVPAVEAAIRGGARWVQYRDKSEDAHRRLAEAQALADCCRRHGAGLIINDDIDLALACAADGVHLGADDAPVAEARRRLGPRAVIGRSCYDRLTLAQRAQEEGADYVAFGSVFPSATKPQAVRASLGLIRRARQALQVPVCAIGGIDAENAPAVAHAGADLLAVVRGLFAAADIEAAARRLVTAIEAGTR